MNATVTICLAAGWAALATASAFSHPMGSGYPGHRLWVRPGPDALEIVYELELPQTLVAREAYQLYFTRRGRFGDREEAEYLASKFSSQVAGLSVKATGRTLRLVERPDQRRANPRDGFLVLRVAARADWPVVSRERLAVEIANENFRDVPGFFQTIFEPRAGWVLQESAPRVLMAGSGADLAGPEAWGGREEHRRVRLAFRRSGPGKAAHGLQPMAGVGPSRPREGGWGAAVTQLARKGASTPWMLLVALLAATCLGAGHALSPGHGKTLVAAYLVGQRGRIRDAVVLGLTVTLAHTSVVFALGVVAISASAYGLPERIHWWLSVVSALFVLGLGLTVLTRRLASLDQGWAGVHGHGQTHDHGPLHDHGHPHPPGHHHHHLDHRHDHHHDHRSPSAAPLSELLTLGLAGGALPCPSALVMLLTALAGGHVALGLGLVLAFSFGLASVLVLLGVLVVISGRTLERTGRWDWLAERMPLASAALVTTLGVLLVVQTIGGGGPVGL